MLALKVKAACSFQLDGVQGNLVDVDTVLIDLACSYPSQSTRNLSFDVWDEWT